MNYPDYLTQSDKVAGGDVVLQGTRIPLRTVLSSLADGDSFEVLLQALPTLTVDHLRAAVAFAAFHPRVPAGSPRRDRTNDEKRMFLI